MTSGFAPLATAVKKKNTPPGVAAGPGEARQSIPDSGRNRALPSIGRDLPTPGLGPIAKSSPIGGQGPIPGTPSGSPIEGPRPVQTGIGSLGTSGGGQGPRRSLGGPITPPNIPRTYPEVPVGPQGGGYGSDTPGPGVLREGRGGGQGPIPGTPSGSPIEGPRPVQTGIGSLGTSGGGQGPRRSLGGPITPPNIPRTYPEVPVGPQGGGYGSDTPGPGVLREGRGGGQGPIPGTPSGSPIEGPRPVQTGIGSLGTSGGGQGPRRSLGGPITPPNIPRTYPEVPVGPQGGGYGSDTPGPGVLREGRGGGQGPIPGTGGLTTPVGSSAMQPGEQSEGKPSVSIDRIDESGDQRIRLSDGTVGRRKPDGTVIVRNPDGSRTRTNPDGSKVVVDVNGNVNRIPVTPQTIDMTPENDGVFGPSVTQDPYNPKPTEPYRPDPSGGGSPGGGGGYPSGSGGSFRDPNTIPGPLGYAGFAPGEAGKLISERGAGAARAGHDATVRQRNLNLARNPYAVDSGLDPANTFKLGQQLSDNSRAGSLEGLVFDEDTRRFNEDLALRKYGIDEAYKGPSLTDRILGGIGAGLPSIINNVYGGAGGAGGSSSATGGNASVGAGGFVGPPIPGMGPNDGPPHNPFVGPPHNPFVGPPIPGMGPNDGPPYTGGNVFDPTTGENLGGSGTYDPNSFADNTGNPYQWMNDPSRNPGLIPGIGGAAGVGAEFLPSTGLGTGGLGGGAGAGLPGAGTGGLGGGAGAGGGGGLLGGLGTAAGIYGGGYLLSKLLNHFSGTMDERYEQYNAYLATLTPEQRDAELGRLSNDQHPKPEIENPFGSGF